MCRSEHEKNRRRDLITALRNRREQMQLSLKRDHSQQNRCFMLGPKDRVLLHALSAANVRCSFCLLDEFMHVGQLLCNKVGK